MARRTPGTIIKRGDRYRAQILLGIDPATGKRRYKSKTCGSQKEACEWLARWNRQPSQATSGITLSELLDRWLAHQEYRRDVSRTITDNTFVWYRSAVERHLKPAPLATTRIDRLDVDLIGRFMASKAKSGRLDGKGGLSATSRRRLHIVLNAALRWAVEREWIARNPMNGLEAPQQPRPHAIDKVWAVDDLRMFLTATAGHRLGAAIHLQAVTGCRRGELLGLQWRDLILPDIGAASVTFHQALVVVDGKVQVREPKTVDSVRRVPIDDHTVTIIKRWQAVQDADRTAWGDGWTDTGFVFTREDGSPISPDSYTRTFKRLVGECDLPPATPHSLRHTAATLMLNNAVPVKVVADVLGHSSTKITADVYQATIERMGREAVAGISEAVR